MSACNLSVYDICVLQNSTYKANLTLTDASGNYVNITSWSFTGSVKENFSQDTALLNFDVSVVSVPSASIDILLTGEKTAQLTKTRYVYDVIASDISTSPHTVYRVLQGKVYVNLGVTEL